MKTALDATRVRADADTDSLVPRFYREAKGHLTDMFAIDPAPEKARERMAGRSPIADGLLPFPVGKAERGRTAADVNLPAGTCWRSAVSTSRDRRVAATGAPATPGSRTDPDVTPMWTAGKARLGYHDHFIVDGSKRRINLALVTPADVMEY